MLPHVFMYCVLMFKQFLQSNMIFSHYYKLQTYVNIKRNLSGNNSIAYSVYRKFMLQSNYSSYQLGHFYIIYNAECFIS